MLLSNYSNSIEARTTQPAMEIHRNLIYVPVDDRTPWERDNRWGIYDSDGRLVEAAAYYRGPGKKLVGQSFVREDIQKDPEIAAQQRLIYGGLLFSHYGHFIISNLARLWLAQHEDLSRFKFLFHGAGTPDGWLSHPFVREIFHSIGITRQNLVVYKRETKIREIFIPRPSAEEHNFVHFEYAKSCHLIGSSVTRERNFSSSEAPVFLAKTNLKRGVQGIVNEDEIANALSALGVEIIYPEKLTVAEQIELFARRRAIIGTAGSAFHTSILWPPGVDLLCINCQKTINSNFAIADIANTNRIKYVGVESELLQSELDNERRFDVGYRLTKVNDVVDEIASLCGL